MALTAATAPAKGAPLKREDDKDRVPVEIERDRWGRPLIAQPDGTKVAYVRASSLGKVLTDDTGLGYWRENVLTWGLARRPDLVLAAQSIETHHEDADKKALREIRDKAKQTGGIDVAATIGTALHRLTERVDREGRVPDVGAEHTPALRAYQEVMRGFEIVASECFVVNDDLLSAGTFDRLLRTLGWLVAPDGTVIPPGTVLVGDVKTSQSDEYFGIEFCVQEAVYQGGRYYDAATGERTPHGAHPGWGLIIWVPAGGTVATLKWVDLERGRALAAHAVEVRELRKAKGLVVDAPAPSPTHPALAEIAACTTDEQCRAVWARYAQVWTDECTAAVQAVLTGAAA